MGDDGVRKRTSVLELLFVPTQVNQVLSNRQPMRPTGIGPHFAQVRCTRGHCLEIFFDVVDRQHPEPEFGRGKLCGNRKLRGYKLTF